jgi:hypothetical protein
MYCIFISKSVAPWFWSLSVPAGTAAVVCILCMVWRTPGYARYFCFYFLGLFLLMALLGIAILKRLLLISPWLPLLIGVALGTSPSRRIRSVLVVTLAMTTGVGWYGIFSRRLYAAPHWIESWQPVAQQAAEIVRNHGIVIGDNPSFFFYLAYLVPTTPSRVPAGRISSDIFPDRHRLRASTMLRIGLRRIVLRLHSLSWSTDRISKCPLLRNSSVGWMRIAA